MSPAPRIWAACRTMAIRSRPLHVAPRALVQRTFSAAPRFYSDDATKQPSTDAGEAAAAKVPESRVTETSTTSEETPVMESPIDRLDDAALEQMLYGGRMANSRQEGGLSEAQEEVLYREGTIPSPDVAEALMAAADSTPASKAAPPATTISDQLLNPGHKFELPSKPYPEGFNVKKRYHPVLEQITRLLMRDGKLSVAQRNMAMVMNYLRTAPAPIYSPKYPLLPGTPPASHLPLNPVLYITIAIDSVAPLVRIKNIPKAGGGGRALEMPVPLAVRQRRRQAFMWLLDVVNKKPSKGSGRKQFAHRVAEEIVAVVEGRSGVWERRKLLHKQSTTARANVGKKIMVKKSVSK